MDGILLLQHARFVITLYVNRSLAYAQWTRLNGTEWRKKGERRKFMIESEKNLIKVAFLTAPSLPLLTSFISAPSLQAPSLPERFSFYP